MKKMMLVFAASVITVAILCACSSEPAIQSAGMPSAAAVSTLSGNYKDGSYQYVGKKDSENYHVEGTMVVNNGAIQSMDWKIVDDARGRVFDETYEEVFGIDLYIQQCRDNLSGMRGYVPALLDTQNPDDVDAVSGATWAYKKFEEAAKALLKQAAK